MTGEIKREINGIGFEMERDGTTWIENPERTESVTIWEHELVALAEFLKRPEVADRLESVRAALADRAR